MEARSQLRHRPTYEGEISLGSEFTFEFGKEPYLFSLTVTR